MLILACSCRIQTVGVFDVKWNTPGATVHSLLSQADADGCLTLHSVQSSEKATTRGVVLREVCTEKVIAAMCLCVDWNPSSSLVSLGLSDGSISIVAVSEAQLEISQSWVAHYYEVWATVFDTCTQQLLSLAQMTVDLAVGIYERGHQHRCFKKQSHIRWVYAILLKTP